MRAGWRRSTRGRDKQRMPSVPRMPTCAGGGVGIVVEATGGSWLLSGGGAIASECSGAPHEPSSGGARRVVCAQPVGFLALPFSRGVSGAVERSWVYRLTRIDVRTRSKGWRRSVVAWDAGMSRQARDDTFRGWWERWKLGARSGGRRDPSFVRMTDEGGRGFEACWMRGEVLRRARVSGTGNLSGCARWQDGEMLRLRAHREKRIRTPLRDSCR
jgi:hypothetical protein